MSVLFTIMQMTLHEAARKRVLVATLIGAGAFLILFAVGALTAVGIFFGTLTHSCSHFIDGGAWVPRDLSNVTIHAASMPSIASTVEPVVELGDCVEDLIARGADVNAVNGAGKTPYGLCVEKNDANMARVLAAHGAR